MASSSDIAVNPVPQSNGIAPPANPSAVATHGEVYSALVQVSNRMDSVTTPMQAAIVVLAKASCAEQWRRIVQDVCLDVDAKLADMQTNNIRRVD